MNSLKTLFFFLSSRLQGQPLTWVGAKFKAASVDEEQVICEKADDLILQGASAVHGFKLFKRTMRRKAVAVPAQKAVDVVSRYFFGRLFICAINGHMNSNYLFNGVAY